MREKKKASKGNDVLLDALQVVDVGLAPALDGVALGRQAARRELAGLVIDGACRDTAQLEKLAIPVYARFANPRAGTAAIWAENQVPIQCGGVRVAPGEILFGDADGVIVASEAELLGALPRAREIQETEARIRARVEAGESLLALTNLEEHVGRLRRGETSALRFTP